MRPRRGSGGVLGMIALIVLAPVGCGVPRGDDLPREPISGTVNFEGRPLKKGMIQFQPASQAEATASGGTIADGRFAVPRNEGPVPGKYTVQVFADVDPGPDLSEGEMPGQPKALRKGARVQLPPRYNLNTELTVEVKPGGPNAFTFDLKR